MDQVFIRGLEIATFIGVADWEQQVKQTVVINLAMATDVRAAAQTDSVADAVDYDAVIQRLNAFVGDSRVQLVETLAERVADLVISELGVRWLRLEISKPQPLRGHHAVGI